MTGGLEGGEIEIHYETCPWGLCVTSAGNVCETNGIKSSQVLWVLGFLR